MIPVQEYINYFNHIWENSPHFFPQFNKDYSVNEKFKCENNFLRLQEKMQEMQDPKHIQKVRKNPAQAFFPIIKAFLETVFDFDKDKLNLILSSDFKNVSKDFFYKARCFAPELKPESIYQGLRNVWIMNGIQLIAKVPIKITPSVFAYSMIYPYSDNFLDNPKITYEEKQHFSERFNCRLHGETVKPKSNTEQQLYKLVCLFEEEFPRNIFPEVYESLYAIQKGQTKSLQLINANSISKKQIQNICFEKGGASVLADGILVAGKLTPEQKQALFGYGIYLQLLDDIQDLKEDILANTKTMFSYLSKVELGEYINKTIHFGREVLDKMHCFPGIYKNDFLQLMINSIENMLIEAVGLNGERYEQRFLNKMEKHSPLHFEFVCERHVKSKSKRFDLFYKYFNSSQSMNSTLNF